MPHNGNGETRPGSLSLSVSSLGEICARFSHNPQDIRHVHQTRRHTLRAWQWRVLLSSLFRRIRCHDRFYLG